MNTIDVDLNEQYCFDLLPLTEKSFQRCYMILEWLKSNMENIKDSNNEVLFNKVNYGYNEGTLKGFGNKPVCDVYLTKTNYSYDINNDYPSSVTSNIIVYLKGNMNNAYLKAAEINDYLIQEFTNNNKFRLLNEYDKDNEFVRTIVNETKIKDSAIRIIPSGKTYGVLVALELDHIMII
jgi:hypothetical protein